MIRIKTPQINLNLRYMVKATIAHDLHYSKNATQNRFYKTGDISVWFNYTDFIMSLHGKALIQTVVTVLQIV